VSEIDGEIERVFDESRDLSASIRSKWDVARDCETRMSVTRDEWREILSAVESYHRETVRDTDRLWADLVSVSDPYPELRDLVEERWSENYGV